MWVFKYLKACFLNRVSFSSEKKRKNKTNNDFKPTWSSTSISCTESFRRGSKDNWFEISEDWILDRFPSSSWIPRVSSKKIGQSCISLKRLKKMLARNFSFSKIEQLKSNQEKTEPNWHCHFDFSMIGCFKFFFHVPNFSNIY